ncbi:esterase/lipase family protein [Myxacorys almedinensis]|uniref:Lipase n=1 Tax=Myxacorys almedinensis A TaxID=2690445 RepID=A0A8J8CIG1_9CYAN|nr:lipase [Myxacorys almedinensis]NDJ17748.1 lipase [Myxacorys almedinensis A]
MPLPTVILPGYLAGAIDYQQMQHTLAEMGVPTVTVPLRKRDWFPTLGGRSVLPILERLDQTVQQVRQQHGTEQINLVGHSAGGWIARIYLGENLYDVHGMIDGSSKGVPGAKQVYAWNAHHYVAHLVTLGTPQTSYERWTLKNLNFVNLSYPGAFYADVHYLCVAGKAVFGARQRGSWLAYSSYQLTGGRGDCWGDGITPIAAAHLEGAENITLDHVWHSPRSPGRWYGTPEVVHQWAKPLINS